MSRRLHTFVGVGVTLATDATALALPPVSLALVSDAWNVPDLGTVPKFELELWADGARALTVATLYGAHLHDITFADLTVTANATTNAFAAVAHARLTGDGPVRVASLNGTVPAGITPTVASVLDLATKTAHVNTVIAARDLGLGAAGDAITVQFVGDSGVQAGSIVETGNAVAIHFKPSVSTVTDVETLIATSTLIQTKTAGTGANVLTLGGDQVGPFNLRDGVTGGDYYVTEGADADHFLLADTRAHAMQGTDVDLTSTGSGTIKVVDVPSAPTQRVHWHSHGLLGLLDDGAVDLDAQKSYMVRCRHSPRAFAYAVTATFGAGAGKVSGRIYPILDV